MSRLDEIRELTRVRVLSFLREPEALFWVFVFPIVLAAVLGFAFRTGGVEPIKIGVVQAEGSQAIVDALSEDEHLIVEVSESYELAFEKVRKGEVDCLLEAGEPPRFTFDPVRPETEMARLRVLRALALAEPGATEPDLELNKITEIGSRYVDYLFPGLIGMNLMGTGMWGVGFAIADVRRRKFLKRLLVTPMRRSSFFLSFMFSRLVFLALELTFLAGFGAWILGVPFVGNIFSLIIVALLGALLFAGLGILVASRVRTIEGVSGLMNLVMVPMWLASGVFFNYDRFPEALHPVIQALPLTALNDALRAVMIEGESLFELWPQLLIMIAWCVGCFAIALKIFRWGD